MVRKSYGIREAMGIFMKRVWVFVGFSISLFKLKPSTISLTLAIFLSFFSPPFFFLLSSQNPLSIYKQSFSSAVFDWSFFYFVCLIFWWKKGHFWIVLIANIEFVYKIGTFHCSSWPASVPQFYFMTKNQFQRRVESFSAWVN